MGYMIGSNFVSHIAFAEIQPKNHGIRNKKIHQGYDILRLVVLQ
jgi:hypothetical protein